MEGGETRGGCLRHLAFLGCLTLSVSVFVGCLLLAAGWLVLKGSREDAPTPYNLFLRGVLGTAAASGDGYYSLVAAADYSSLNIVQRSSPNKGGYARATIDRIVIHWWGDCALKDLEAVDKRFSDPSSRVSAHYGVSGIAIYQWADESEASWHSGNSAMNARSIGIEHDACVGRAMTEETYQTSARLIAAITSRHNIPLDRTHIIGHDEVIGGEEEGGTQCPGTIDVDRLIELAKSLRQGAPQTQAGLSTDRLALAYFVSEWIKVQTNGKANIDPAILYSLTSGESAGCSNAGQCYAATEMRRRGFLDQLAALEKFLPIWKAGDIRSNPGSFSSLYIGENYSLESVKGSCGAGASGCSQFMAGTAWPHCVVIGEPCDLWEPITAMKFMALELHRLGYDADLSFAQKVQVMRGWNNAPGWLSGIVSTAEALAQSADYANVSARVAFLNFAGGGFQAASGWRAAVLWALNLLGLGPSRQQVAGAGGVSAASLAARSLPMGEGTVIIDVTKDVPPGGEMRNVIKWATLNQRIEVKPGETYDFLRVNAASGGWAPYEVAAGIVGGGVCINASMLWELARGDSRLEVVESHPHAKISGYPWYKRVIQGPGTCPATGSCAPGSNLVLRNVSSQTITIVWTRGGDNLSVSIAEPLPTLAKGEIDTKSLFGRSVRAEGGGNLRISSAGVDQALDALGVSDEVDVTFRFVPQKELDAIFEGAQAYVWEAVHAPAKEGQVVIIISKTLHTGSLGWSKEAGVAHELLRVAMAFEGDPDWDSLDLRTRSWTEAVPLAQRFELLESRGTPR